MKRLQVCGFCSKHRLAKRGWSREKGQSGLESQGPAASGAWGRVETTSPSVPQRQLSTCQSKSPPPGVIHSQFRYAPHSECHKPGLQKDSMKNRWMPSWGQAEGPLHPILPSPGQSSPPPAGAQAGAQGLHLSEAPALTSFPRTQGAQGRGQGGASGREENQEQVGGRLGAEAGARTGSFWDCPNFKNSVQLNDCRPELTANFYSRRKRVK